MNDLEKYLVVKRAVDNADPCGLLKMGAPDDEYELEAKRIAEVIEVGDSTERMAEVAAAVFSRAFSRETASDRFLGFAEEVRHEFCLKYPIEQN